MLVVVLGETQGEGVVVVGPGSGKKEGAHVSVAEGEGLADVGVEV